MSTVQHVPDPRDYRDDRAPSYLHAVELAERLVQLIRPALDKVECLLFLRAQPGKQVLILPRGSGGDGRHPGRGTVHEEGP